MQKNFNTRLVELERLEAQAQRQAAERPVYQPPTFEEALRGVALFRAALADGRAQVCYSVWTWRNGEPVYGHFLCHMPDPEVCHWGVKINNWRTRLGADDPTSVEAWDAWLAEAGRAVAFWMSRTIAEIDAATTITEDSLFWTPEQYALMDAWAQLVEQGDDDAQL